MLMADILHSCTDAGIAEAAVASIGGPFAARIRAEAKGSGVAVGVLTASLVSRFAAEATERDWRDLAAAMARADHPVLSGLQAVIERMLAVRHRVSPRPSLRDVMPMAGCMARTVPAPAAAISCTL